MVILYVCGYLFLCAAARHPRHPDNRFIPHTYYIYFAEKYIFFYFFNKLPFVQIIELVPSEKGRSGGVSTPKFLQNLIVTIINN